MKGLMMRDNDARIKGLCIAVLVLAAVAALMEVQIIDLIDNKTDALSQQSSPDAVLASVVTDDLIQAHVPPRVSVKAVSGGSPLSLRSRRFIVTAYCPCAKCCGRWADGVTASGVPALGKIIAAPRQYPFGTVMHIPGYGRATVQDRGGAIKGAKLDVLFPTHDAALQWGRKELMVTIEAKR